MTAPGSEPPAEARADGELTCDTIARGRLSLWQRRAGYRFNLDSILLATFAGPAPRVCDLGTGSGIVGLWLAGDGAGQVLGLELQPGLAALARRNAEENGLSDRFRVLEADLRTFGIEAPEDAFDLVVMNPPFGPPAGGHVDADPERATARHELAARLEDVFAAGARILARSGRMCLVHRADRLPDVLACARAARLVPARLRLVHPRAGRPATRLLFEARPRPHRLQILPPLYVHDAEGAYSGEVAGWLGDRDVEEGP